VDLRTAEVVADVAEAGGVVVVGPVADAALGVAGDVLTDDRAGVQPSRCR
jgi:hypothetical protein